MDHLSLQCSKRHEFLCPEEENKKSCKLTRCPYPHRSNFHIKQNSKSIIPKKSTTSPNAIESPINDDNVNQCTKRYFSSENRFVPNAINSNDEQNVYSIVSNSSEHSTSSSSQDIYEAEYETEHTEQQQIYKKLKLGTLPSFIPIG